MQNCNEKVLSKIGVFFFVVFVCSILQIKADVLKLYLTERYLASILDFVFLKVVQAEVKPGIFWFLFLFSLNCSATDHSATTPPRSLSCYPFQSPCRKWSVWKYLQAYKNSLNWSHGPGSSCKYLGVMNFDRMSLHLLLIIPDRWL